jgi:dTDP-4-amino-4,6-dideoxygalactose transaminase
MFAADHRAGLERALADEYGSAAVLLTDSGTSALALALRAAVRERPGAVALPAYGCYDIATAADAAEVRFALYDIEPATLGPDLDSLRSALMTGARTIVVAYLYGIPIDPAPIGSLAHEFGAVMVEDAAQAAGTRIGGRPAGSHGRYGVLSFGRGKGVTGGRGGALLVNTPDALEPLAKPREALRGGRGSAGDVAVLAAQWALGRAPVYGALTALPFLGLGETIYRPPHEPGGMTRFAAGVLLRTRSEAEREAEIRRRTARRLSAHVERGSALRTPAVPFASEAGFLRLPVAAAPEALRVARSADARRLGVWPGYPRALADLDGFCARRMDPGRAISGSRSLAQCMLTLPTHSRLRERELGRLCAWIDGLR